MNNQEIQELARDLNISISEGDGTIRFEWSFNLLFHKETLEQIDPLTLKSALISQLEQEINSWK